MRLRVLSLVLPFVLTAGVERVHAQRTQIILPGAETLRGLSRTVGLAVWKNEYTPIEVEAVRNAVAARLRASGFTLLGENDENPENYPLIQVDLNSEVLLINNTRQWLTILLFTFNQRLAPATRSNVRFAAPTYFQQSYVLVGALRWQMMVDSAVQLTDVFIREFDRVNPRR